MEDQASGAAYGDGRQGEEGPGRVGSIDRLDAAAATPAHQRPASRRVQAGTPLTADAEGGLRGLHREAQRTNRRSSDKQALQEQLTEADAETRRLKAHQADAGGDPAGQGTPFG